MPTIAISATDSFGNRGFIKVRDGRVSYVSASGMALALSNFFNDRAVEFELAAEEVTTPEELLEVANAHFRVQSGPKRVDLVPVARARQTVLG